MKKVLFTSTALVAFAGAAAAEVTISGWAEMGVAGGENVNTQFFQDVDVDFDMSGETDNGLTFGASVDLDEAMKLGDTYDDQGVAIFLSGEFGTVTLGDTDTAFMYAVGNIADFGDPGTIADDETAHWGYQEDFLKGSYDGQILRYDYTFEDFGFAVSLEQDDATDVELDDADRDRYDYAWGVGATWKPQMGPGTLALGIAYEQADNGVIGFGLTDLESRQLGEELLASDLTPDEIDAIGEFFGYRYNSDTADQITISLGNDVSNWGVSAGYTMDNGFSIGTIYASFDGDNLDSGDYWGIGAGYNYYGFDFYANYGTHDFQYSGDANAGLTTDGWGFAMGYDLGGGLSVLAGYGRSDYELKAFGEKVDGDFDTYSLGLSMAF